MAASLSAQRHVTNCTWDWGKGGGVSQTTSGHERKLSPAPTFDSRIMEHVPNRYAD